MVTLKTVVMGMAFAFSATAILDAGTFVLVPYEDGSSGSAEDFAKAKPEPNSDGTITVMSRGWSTSTWSNIEVEGGDEAPVNREGSVNAWSSLTLQWVWTPTTSNPNDQYPPGTSPTSSTGSYSAYFGGSAYIYTKGYAQRDAMAFGSDADARALVDLSLAVMITPIYEFERKSDTTGPDAEFVDTLVTDFMYDHHEAYNFGYDNSMMESGYGLSEAHAKTASNDIAVGDGQSSFSLSTSHPVFHPALGGP